MAWNPAVQELHLRLAATTVAGKLMRVRLRGWLDAAGVDGSAADDLIAACSEAVNNAIEHPAEPTQPAVEVLGSIDGRTVILTVRDFGGWPDIAPSRDREHYGLPLMRALTDTVDIAPSPGGTTVTLRLGV